jgi:hypothetical protein
MKRKYILAFIPLVVLASLFAIWLCLNAIAEPSLNLKVENQSDQTLTIRVNGFSYFDVLPNSSAKGNAGITHFQKFFIEGVNKSGEIAYSKIFTAHDLITNQRNLVVIPPTEEKPYLPLQIENKTNNNIWVYVDDATIGLVKPYEFL